MVKLLEGLEIQTNLPVDNRTIVKTLVNRDAISKIVRYIGMETYVTDEKKKYRLEEGIENSHWVEIKAVANASELVTDPEHLTVSQSEKDKWNGKADSNHNHNGTYALVSHSHTAEQITQDATHRFTTDTEKSNWNSKSDGNHNHNSNYAPINHKHNWDNIDGKPGTFNPTAHNHSSENINSMNGYSKPSETSAIVSGDTLNKAIGKLEKALEGKQPSGSYALTNHNHNGVYAPNVHSHTANDVGAYTKGEVDSKLDVKANSTHSHSEYAVTNHKHTDLSQSISEINSFFDLYSLNKKYIKSEGDTSVKVLKNTIIKVGEKVFKLNNDVVLNQSNLDTGSFTVGKDYYIYCCNQENKAIFKISLNSTYPNGFNANNSRKVGGFHYGDCRRIKTDTLEPINSSSQAWGANWEDNVYQGILPFSVWTLLFRPMSEPEGMVYSESLNKWIDIYLTSTNYLSEYNATPMTGSEGIMYYDWYEKIARKTKKFPLSYAEFCCIADGSPNGRDDNNDYAWSKNGNSGRNKTGIIKKAVSSIGCKDCTGNVWEVGTSEAFTTHQFDTGSWSWRNKEQVKKGGIWAAFNDDIDIGLHGGGCVGGSYCGSRTLNCFLYPWYVSSYVGCRLACDSL